MNPKLSMSLETYLEAIAELQARHGAVRTSDLAECIGCKRSSVTIALQRLAEKGLINYQVYRPVTLTEAGTQAITRLSRFHGIIEDFLENVLALPPDYAREEACRLEHSMSKRTIERMKNFLDFIRENGDEIAPGKISEVFAASLKIKTD